jgi:MFS family permease
LTTTENTLSRADQRRNFRLGLVNGSIVKLTMVLIDSGTVTAWFLAQLGVSNLMIGLVPSIRMGSSFLLQILVSGHLQRYPYKMPFYRAMGTVRVVTLASIALLIALVPTHSPWLVAAFFALLVAYSIGSGLTSLPFMDIVAKVIPPTRRGSFFGQRSFWGGILALGGSAFVGFVLSEPAGLPFPLNIALLFALAAITLAFVAGIWSMVKEPPSEADSARVRLPEQFRRGVRLLVDDAPYRTFVLARMALLLAQSAGPFYIVYARDVLGISPQMVGVYLAARTTASIVTNLFWARISDRRGNRLLLRIAHGIGLSMPLLALFTGLVGQRLPHLLPGLSWAFGAIFVASGAFVSASMIGRTGYLLDLAPPARRSLYLGFTNTMFGMASFASAIGGLIAEFAGFTTLLVVSAILWGLALFISFLLVEPRESIDHTARGTATPSVVRAPQGN